MECTHAASVTFRKATASGGNDTGPNCVEVGSYRKAEASNPSGNCVEAGVARQDIHAMCTPETCLTPGIEPGDIVVRDSKLGPDSPLLVFKPEAWTSLMALVCVGGREVDEAGRCLMRDPRNPGIILYFTAAEWDAFQDGCLKGEFHYALSSTSA